MERYLPKNRDFTIVALILDGVDARGRPTRLYVSAAERQDERTFRVLPGATITLRTFCAPRTRGRPRRAWFVAVRAADLAAQGQRLRQVHDAVNQYRRFAGKGNLVDPRDPLAYRPERPHYREAARWVKAGKQFLDEVARAGYVEVSITGGEFIIRIKGKVGMPG